MNPTWRKILDVSEMLPCLSCGAKPGCWCRTKSGRRARFLHEPRMAPVRALYRTGYVDALEQSKRERSHIVDIGFRMLTPRELARAQGFPDDYELDALEDGTPLTTEQQVRLVGNSVPPALAAALVRANVETG